MNDVVVVALMPEADPDYVPWLMPTGGLFVYVSAGMGRFDLAYEELPGAGYSYPQIGSLDDLDGDGRNDLLYTVRTCGAHTCFHALKGVRWDASGHWEPLFVEPIDVPGAEFRVVDSTEGQAREIVVQVGMIDSVGAGPQRTFEHTYRWDGVYRAGRGARNLQHPIHLINDADVLLDQGICGGAGALCRSTR